MKEGWFGYFSFGTELLNSAIETTMQKDNKLWNVFMANFKCLALNGHTIFKQWYYILQCKIWTFLPAGFFWTWWSPWPNWPSWSTRWTWKYRIPRTKRSKCKYYTIEYYDIDKWDMFIASILWHPTEWHLSLYIPEVYYSSVKIFVLLDTTLLIKSALDLVGSPIYEILYFPLSF